MALFEKTTVKLLGRALAAYLPSTRTEVVQISSPKNMAALRVWYEADNARDYFVMGGGWHQIHALMRFSVEPHYLGVSAGTGMQLISATIASDLAHWHRRMVFPMAADHFPSPVTQSQRDESAQTLGECVNFLTALSRGIIPFTDRADQLASVLLKLITEMIEQAKGEAEKAADKDAIDDAPVRKLQRAVAENLTLLDTEVVFLEERKLWALSFVNVDGATNWVANDGEGWFDSEGMFWDEENDSSVDFTILEVVLEVAWLVLYKLTDEFKLPAPIEHLELFSEVVEWMVALRDESKDTIISTHAGGYLMLGSSLITSNQRNRI